MISHKTLLYANTLLFVGLAGGLKAAPIGFTPMEQTAQLNATSGDHAFVIKKARKSTRIPLNYATKTTEKSR